ASRTPPLPRGPLVRRPRLGPAGPVGVLLPQPTVDGTRLDDLLGEGWALLTHGPHPTLPAGVRPRVLPLATLPDLGPGLRGRWVLVRPDRVVAAVGPRAGSAR
ncbi:MAG: Monooxygenase, FAD-binding, partial [Klenkia sp.]|nr:Monooxygenase, FAD-binding [Klenkia sp.]